LSSDLITITGQTLTVHPSSSDYSSATTITAYFRVNLPSPHDTPYDTEFDIVISHPCIGALFAVDPEPSLTISNSIFAASTSVTIPMLPYTRSDGQPTIINCGYQSYTISSSTEAVISVPFLSITFDLLGTTNSFADTLNLYSEDDSQVAVHDVYLSIYLEDYSSAKLEDLNVQATLTPCVATISTSSVSSQSYDIGKSSEEYTIDVFTFSPACSYAFTYSMSYTAAGSGLTNDGKITFDSSTRTFTFDSSDMT